MPFDLSHLNLGTAALILFVLCAGYVMLRGIWRMLLGTLVLAASAGLAFYVWQHAAEWSLAVLGRPSGFITVGLPCIVFVVAMVTIRNAIKFIASPFTGGDDSAPRSFTNLPMRLVCALIPAGILWLIAATLVHHAGSIAEIREVAEPTKSPSETSVFLQRMKIAVERTLPAAWLAFLDPLTEPTRLALAKLIATQSTPEYEPVIDPATGQPVPRAVLVDDPALDGLAKSQDFSTLLRHPKLTEILNDPKVQALLHPK
jgi:hypothetical protein